MEEIKKPANLKSNRPFMLVALVFVVLALIGGTGYFIWSNQNTKTKQSGEPSIVLPEVVELKVVPKDVNAYGSATRAFAAKGVKAAYLHTIKVRLPEIRTAGVEYYGWLSKPDKSHMFKTGKLIKYPDGLYHLEFKDTKDYEGYDLVLITAEQKDDATPEVIILQGKF